MITPPLVKVWFSHARAQWPGAVQGCVYLGEPDRGPYARILESVDGFADDETIRETVDAVFHRRKSIVIRLEQRCGAGEAHRVAASAGAGVTEIRRRNILVVCPLLIERRLCGAVAMEFEQGTPDYRQHCLEKVESAVRWLQLLAQTASTVPEPSAHAALAVQITVQALSQDSASTAATAIATQLASRLSCERVSIGFTRGASARLFALSHSARYEARQNLIGRIEAAMDEAIVQKETLVYPAATRTPLMQQSHEELARHHGAGGICTVPMVHEGRVVGAFTLERGREHGEFETATVELCEQLTGLFTPILEYRRLVDRPLHSKALDLFRSLAGNLFGRGHLVLKSGLVFAAAVLLALTWMHWEYRISANSVLEGTVERVITAPEEGFIQEASARPGDLVDAGERLAMLDDRDLKLERLKWEGKQKQTSREYREALASHDKTRIGILRAQLEQARAQIDILDKKLERTVITAPISGVIVSGDFTRALGSPVERGQILYKVSPLDRYRVLMEVDETDIADLAVGMKGELTLSAAVEDSFDIVVEKITPVSVPGEGANYFQVEASMLETPAFLRPGMQGVSKIDAGERRLLWIWTHRMMDWLRLQIWSWW